MNLDGVRRIGIDARGMQPRSTGLGNYIKNVLVPMAAANPSVDFFLYSNIPLEAPAGINIHLRVSKRQYAAPFWMHALLPEQLRRDRIEVFRGAIGYVPVLRCPCPTIVTIHDVVYRFAPQTMNRLTRWNRAVFQTLSGKRADKLVAISKATAADAKLILRREVDAVIPPAISPRYRLKSPLDVEDIRRKHGIERAYFLCIGTLEPRKNIRQLVDAYKALRDSGGSLPDLVLAGSVGWLQDDMEVGNDAGDAQGTVKYVGYVDIEDLPSLYAGATALLMPSIYEGFGMPVLEAQRCGTPVVHGTHGSMVEAGGRLGVAVAPQAAEWRGVFDKFKLGELPLVSRLPGDSALHADAQALMSTLINACHAARTVERPTV